MTTGPRQPPWAEPGLAEASGRCASAIAWPWPGDTGPLTPLGRQPSPGKDAVVPGEARVTRGTGLTTKRSGRTLEFLSNVTFVCFPLWQMIRKLWSLRVTRHHAGRAAAHLLALGVALLMGPGRGLGLQVLG